VFYEEEWGVNANRPLKAQDRKTGLLTWRPIATTLVRAEYAELSADSGFFAPKRPVAISAHRRRAARSLAACSSHVNCHPERELHVLGS